MVSSKVASLVKFRFRVRVTQAAVKSIDENLSHSSVILREFYSCHFAEIFSFITVSFKMEDSESKLLYLPTELLHTIMKLFTFEELSHLREVSFP